MGVSRGAPKNTKGSPLCYFPILIHHQKKISPPNRIIHSTETVKCDEDSKNSNYTMKGEKLSANNVHPPFIYKKGQRSLYYHLTDDSLLTLVCISQEIEKLSSCRIGFTCQWCNNHARWPIVMARESSPPWPFIAKQTRRGRTASATFHDHIFIFLRYFFCSA